VLTKKIVQEIYNGELDPRISYAREMNDKLIMHTQGRGMQEFLSRINNYENAAQHEARVKHAISNKYTVEELLRNVDNAFQAKGGSKNYKFTTDQESKEKELIDKLVNIKDNYSLSQYIESVWFDKYINDPNGLIFMEVSQDEESEEDQELIEPCYKSIHSIRAYEQSGIFVNWVIFEPHLEYETEEKEDNEVKVFWAVDKFFYYEYELRKGELNLLQEIENTFGKVPAILCSNIIDNKTGWKKSAIDSQIELLDKCLVSNSVLNITEFQHAYPREWAYVDECSSCEGTGQVMSQNREGVEMHVPCSVCDGTGKATKKDVTDLLELKIPEKDDVKIDPPNGFTILPIDALRLMYDSIDRVWHIMYFSHWGTTVSKDAKNETATGRFLDAQPVNNRLDKYSKSIEQAHTALANFIGEFYYPDTFDGALIQMGRRYLIETPDQIWEKYIKAKNDNAPTSTLDLLLLQFLESEFKENEHMFIYEKKKVILEPFVHWDIVTVQGLNVDEIDYKKKLYFSDWVQTKKVNEVIKTDLQTLDNQLTAFVNNKNVNQNKISNE